jgi:enoyl-CoA hydratase
MASDHEAELVVDRRGPVLVLRLNRPEARNALTSSLLAALAVAIADAESDPAIRVVVLTGTGDRSFCAGMDLREFAEGGITGSLPAGALEGFQRLIRGRATIPLVGAANASALAGGLELLLGCDVIVASSAAQFGLPEVRRGLLAAGGGTFISQRVPLGIALELTLTGASITAARAYELGLVNAVVEPDAVLPAAIEVADRIAGNAPLSLVATKELVRLAVSDPGRAEERLGHWQPLVFQSADAKEGATAFVEKRLPVWEGR